MSFNNATLPGSVSKDTLLSTVTGLAILAFGVTKDSI